MDAIKFLKEFKRMCEAHEFCVDCTIRKISNHCNPGTLSEETQNKIVTAVEQWSEENPEEIGKKYIIEIDKVARSCDYKLYHVKNANGVWVSEKDIAKLEEYKGEQHGRC